ncbi:bacillithiol system redox-active protein YtxJ [Cyclobacteriaceae bacterium]|nr:bacillithiol system redox-active protein YtxJ [Cyclobacteriaceae bacterium]
MNWNIITSVEDLDKIDQLSTSNPVLIFKHSTRCPTSSMALSRVERNWNDSTPTPFFLDLIAHRDVSSAIAEKYHVEHQSPQALLIKDKTCTFNASHLNISLNEIEEQC